MIRIGNGLDIPVAGAPVQEISLGPAVRSVAIVADDYVGLRPSMAVRDGDSIRVGEPVVTDKTHPEIRLTAPGSGVVRSVNRGAKRKLLSIVIDLEGDEDNVGQGFSSEDLSSLDGQRARETLLESGLWTALRTRPYNRIPAPGGSPRSIFVTAMDSNPLAADPAVVLSEQGDDFVGGLHVLSHLTEGAVYVCHEAGKTVPGEGVPGVTLAEFGGPHPAGLPGTHIHFLDPVNAQRTVWFIGYQDVIAYGALFRTGRIRTERVVALGGPGVERPRLLRTRMGANLNELTAGSLRPGEQRVVSGSVLAGRRSEAPTNFLGRYHTQVSALPEGRRREFLGWQMPGFNKFSATRTFATGWSGDMEKVAWDTNMHGSRRAMVPIGVYEKVMPLDILPTQLLRALIVGDTDEAQMLGCLELDEEDLGLCTFVCPSKYDYGPILRRNLTTIEREG
ncbi:MAG: Na(+)-translocating NADH-quinone reductase subunit A [Planctomycetota bacterium]